LCQVVQNHIGAMAGDACAAEGVPETGESQISDEVAARLFRSLELMEADYQQTLALDRRQLVHPEPLVPRGSLLEDSDDQEDESDIHNSLDGLPGYAALGSDDEGSGSEIEVRTPCQSRGSMDISLATAKPQGGFTGLHPATAIDGGEWGGFQSVSATAVDPHSAVKAFHPPPRLEQDPSGGQLQDELTASQDEAPKQSPWAAPESQVEESFENFADFESSSTALPGPSSMSPLQACPLSDEDIRLIKATMREVRPEPPTWAQSLSDRDLQRMVKDLLRA